MNLEYLFDHNGKLFQPLSPISPFAGPLPSQDNIILFEDSEAKCLNNAGLPEAVWRVRQLAFDISEQEVKRVTLTLELRNKKAERENL